MTAGVRELLGLVMASVSFLGSIIICALPQWRVTKIQDLRSDDFYVLSEGLWKFCYTTRTYDSVPECRTYDSEYVSITQDLEVVRVLIVIGIIVGFIGILLRVVGSKFFNFVPDDMKKSKMVMASGVVLLIAGLFVLISVCWITNTINDNFENDLSPSSLDFLKRKLGTSVYIGWITTVLWFLGGGLLCSSFLCTDGTD
ncbi:claudin-like protein ZF-A89 [Archocentrus centrarchus]|uniref:claudin-like protein ZF-A89 n=1 Tax=Archocentrus centrarchus TaxID=63155 RepID=UPI0011EA2438|nr:claudin-like protein ZF-A89 [Archocentrus centrarchus]